jgi:hypothetical protein
MGSRDPITTKRRMAKRRRRVARPLLELVECRELLSSIIDVLASTSAASHHGSSASTNLAAALSASRSGFTTTNDPSQLTQGPLAGTQNVAITPSGTFKPAAIKRQRFVARYVGPYSVIPGKTNTQSFQVIVQAAGTANTMLHSDFQARIVTPSTPATPDGTPTPISGVSSIFDRNLNTNTVLGFDFADPNSTVNSSGLPDQFTSVSIDVNSSAGTYDEAYGQGVINIKYEPSGKHAAGTLSQGTAIVTIKAQIYASDASSILRNATIDP